MSKMGARRRSWFHGEMVLSGLLHHACNQMLRQGLMYLLSKVSHVQPWQMHRCAAVGTTEMYSNYPCSSAPVTDGWLFQRHWRGQGLPAWCSGNLATSYIGLAGCDASWQHYQKNIPAQDVYSRGGHMPMHTAYAALQSPPVVDFGVKDFHSHVNLHTHTLRGTGR